MKNLTEMPAKKSPTRNIELRPWTSTVLRAIGLSENMALHETLFRKVLFEKKCCELMRCGAILVCAVLFCSLTLVGCDSAAGTTPNRANNSTSHAEQSVAESDGADLPLREVALEVPGNAAELSREAISSSLPPQKQHVTEDSPAPKTDSGAKRRVRRSAEMALREATESSATSAQGVSPPAAPSPAVDTPLEKGPATTTPAAKAPLENASVASVPAVNAPEPRTPNEPHPVTEGPAGDRISRSSQIGERPLNRPMTPARQKPAGIELAKPEPATKEHHNTKPDASDPSKKEPSLAEPTQAEPAKTEPAKTKGGKKTDPSDEFFQTGVIPEIRITLTEKEEAQLRRDLRRYVDISFTENGTTVYKKVKMKLKGAAGSFRDLNDRPAMTLSMRGKGERFHGLEKFHLNNSVQDESYLNEWLASELCREAGLPAARTTHARVWLNGRDLGFYVLKEGMDERFVKRHFKNAKGNFYDGAFCADIDAPLEKEFGDGPDDRSDLKALIDACHEGDQAKRWQLIEEKVAIDDFINFAAMELMMCHWDGYCQNRNNYRIYFPADDKKIRFLPHGMDQMFGDINFGVFHIPGPTVANVVLQNPAVHARYRQRVRELLPLFAPEKLHAKIDVVQARIRPVLAAIHEDRARQFDARVMDFKNRIAGRQQAIKSQFPPEPIAFNSEGWALAEDWVAQPQGDAKLEFLESEGKKVLSLTPGPSNQVQSSFRTKVRLARGTYRLDARVKASGVTATPEEKGFGAGVRLGGGMRKNHVIGTTDWQTISHEFEIGQDLQEVELVAELRSMAGSAQFDRESLRIYKLK